MEAKKIEIDAVTALFSSKMLSLTANNPETERSAHGITSKMMCDSLVAAISEQVSDDELTELLSKCNEIEESILNSTKT